MSLNTIGNVADLNDDGVVDLKDWDLFSDRWKWEQVLLAADLDRNGIVDERDFYMFVREWLWME